MHAVLHVDGATDGDPRNVASAAVLRKIGVRYEGRMRDTAYIHDGWRDSDLYAIMVDD